MEVNMSPTQRVPAQRVDGVESTRRAPHPTDEVSLHSDNVHKLLDQQPLVRAEEIERGQLLFADVQYPPAELINGISKLLAEHLVDRSTA